MKLTKEKRATEAECSVWELRWRNPFHTTAIRYWTFDVWRGWYQTRHFAGVRLLGFELSYQRSENPPPCLFEQSINVMRHLALDPLPLSAKDRARETRRIIANEFRWLGEKLYVWRNRSYKLGPYWIERNEDRCIVCGKLQADHLHSEEELWEWFMKVRDKTSGDKP